MIDGKNVLHGWGGGGEDRGKEVSHLMVLREVVIAQTVLHPALVLHGSDERLSRKRQQGHIFRMSQHRFEVQPQNLFSMLLLHQGTCKAV